MKNLLIFVPLLTLFACKGGEKSSTKHEKIVDSTSLSLVSESEMTLGCHNHKASQLSSSGCSSVNGIYTSSYVPDTYKCINSVTNKNFCEAKGGSLIESCTINGNKLTKIGSITNENSIKACKDAGGVSRLSCEGISNQTNCEYLTSTTTSWALVSPATYISNCTGYILDSEEKCNLAGGTYNSGKIVNVDGYAITNAGLVDLSIVEGSNMIPVSYLEIGEVISKMEMTIYYREGGTSYWSKKIEPQIVSAVIEDTENELPKFRVNFQQRYTTSDDDKISAKLYIYDLAE